MNARMPLPAAAPAAAAAQPDAPAGPRRRIALHVEFSDGWLGGVNYFGNLVRAVQELPAPGVEFVVVTGRRPDERLLAGFPPVEVVRDAMVERWSAPWLRRKLHQKFTLSDPPLRRLLQRHGVDLLSHAGYLGAGSPIPTLGWVPDFQHLHLPEVFRRWDLVRRNAEIARIVRGCTRVIVSSESARGDLLRIAPEAAAKAEVLRFAGPVPAAARLVDLPTLQARYGFAGDFVFLPNQYWSHKNHLAVIRAVAALRRDGRRLTVLSTGKTADYRQPDFFAGVEAEIARLGVAEDYRVLGVLPYDDVASLLHHCRFVVNPSRFEGWSTTVEEAKAAGKPIVLSDIPVHREQAPADADFFAPQDVEQLATLMWRRWTAPAGPAGRAADGSGAPDGDAVARRRAFARTYLAIVERACSGGAP